MISLAIALVAILALRQMMQFQNQHRDRQQGVKIDPESREAIESEEIVALDKDETDWENVSFRYYL
jgi:hypothetical protein